MRPSKYQSNPSDKILESRVSAQIIPARITLQPDQPVGPLVVSPFEICEDALTIPEAGVDHGNRIAGGVMVLSLEVTEFCQDLLGFRGSPFAVAIFLSASAIGRSIAVSR